MRCPAGTASQRRSAAPFSSASRVARNSHAAPVQCIVWAISRPRNCVRPAGVASGSCAVARPIDNQHDNAVLIRVPKHRLSWRDIHASSPLGAARQWPNGKLQ